MNDDVLKKIRESPTVIQGFPGFGLIGSIVTEFMIEHLKCVKLDQHYFEELPANLAIHEGKIIEPISVYYNEHYNILLIHSLISGNGIEWKAADYVNSICEKVNARELVCIEGVSSGADPQGRTFYHCTDSSRIEYLQSKGAQPLKEGIIMGVTSALLLKAKVPMLCLFGEAESSMPDNNASASIIEMLDKIFDLQIDPQPLRESAKALEEKFKSIMNQMQSAGEEKDKKMMSYVG
ncbi:MAG: proteasome assembly chaperone family protein [Candidatus Woesearchaeota archaeon]